MANINAPFGLRVVQSEGKEYRVRRYPKKSGNAIYPGDPVIADASGAVDLGTAGGALCGVAIEYGASTSTTPIAIVDDPEAVFEIQASANLLALDLFQNADLSTGTPDSVLRRSTFKLNSAAMDTTATRQLKVLGLSSVGTNAYGSYARVNVKINNHIFKGGTGSAGV